MWGVIGALVAVRARLVGDIGERDPHTALVLLKHLGETLVLAVEHDAGAGKLEALEPVVVLEVRGCFVVEINHVAEINARLNLLILAELPVGYRVARAGSAEIESPLHYHVGPWV
jgi:hypothetical protein